MGDLIGSSVDAALEFIPRDELTRLLRARLSPCARAALFADACRLNALYMIARAGSGHIGSSFSSLDIVSYLHLEVLERTDLYFSSKGHDAPGLYAVLLGMGKLPFELIHRLRRLSGLPGHPDVQTPGIIANTGSLGMGISKAKGIALARRMRGIDGRIYVLTGDGELQEGQIWESLISASNFGLSELTVIVDSNRLQSDTLVEKTSSLGDLVAKFRSFGWYVDRVNGHDLPSLARSIENARAVARMPQVIIADTIKGKGVSFMEGTALDSDVALYRFHSGAPDARSYALALDELSARIGRVCEEAGIQPLARESVTRPAAAPNAAAPDRLIATYAQALVEHMEQRPEIVVLDADLAVDTGGMPARERWPARFVECGIAEMDMVSMAGAMARTGLLPVCHSFACFLSTRANEQIYNNASERSKVVYVGSLAGLLPGGPGHSHQGVRDIAALAGIPGLTLLAPSSSAELRAALRWAFEDATSSVWLRLESVPCDVPFVLPEQHVLQEGHGTWLRAGNDAVIVSYGPVLLSEAYRAAELLEASHNLQVGVVTLPWLNRVALEFVAELARSTAHVFALDNHYTEGGQADRLARAWLEAGVEHRARFHALGVEDLPACGSNAEVLAFHRLDARSLAERVWQVVKG